MRSKEAEIFQSEAPSLSNSADTSGGKNESSSNAATPKEGNDIVGYSFS